MAYRYRRQRRRYSARRGTSRYRTTGGYRGRRTYRRTGRRRGGQQRLVIQVIGGSTGGVAVSPITMGQKAARVVRARY